MAFHGVRFCFVSDRVEVFKPAEILSYTKFTPESLSELSIRLLDTPGQKATTVKVSAVVPIHDLKELDNPPPDLIHLYDGANRAAILHTLRQRFAKDAIYSAVGPILIAFNPFRPITGMYDSSVIAAYMSGSKNLSSEPHVYALAREALVGLSLGRNQSLIISGESGAGKTEATKQCLNYLSESVALARIAGSGGGGGVGSSTSSSSSNKARSSSNVGVGESIQQRIISTSPVLEAWGNAKTTRNNNSSRFGKFIQIWFGPEQKAITSSKIETYLLEKSRVCVQEKGERNYHVFYNLLRGLSLEALTALHLEELSASPRDAVYLSSSDTAIEDVDDREAHATVAAAYEVLGFGAEEQNRLDRILAGILHFGNVVFEANPNNTEETIIAPSSTKWLAFAAEMFEVDLVALQQALLYRVIKSGGAKRSSSVLSPYIVPLALENKNALSKELYCRCFDWIVARVNEAVNATSSSAAGGGGGGGSGGGGTGGGGRMIGILDIFGFEIFGNKPTHTHTHTHTHTNTYTLITHQKNTYSSFISLTPPYMFSHDAVLIPQTNREKLVGAIMHKFGQ